MEEKKNWISIIDLDDTLDTAHARPNLRIYTYSLSASSNNIIIHE